MKLFKQDKIESINEQTQQDLFEKLNRVRTLSTINYFTLNHVPGLPGYGSQLHPIIQVCLLSFL